MIIARSLAWLRVAVALALALAFLTHGAQAQASTTTTTPPVSVWFESDGDGGWQGYAGTESPTYGDDVRTVTVIDAEEASPEAVDALITIGAYSLPTDGCECVYAPTGVEINLTDGTTWAVDPDAAYAGLTQVGPESASTSAYASA